MVTGEFSDRVSAVEMPQRARLNDPLQRTDGSHTNYPMPHNENLFFFFLRGSTIVQQYCSEDQAYNHNGLLQSTNFFKTYFSSTSCCSHVLPLIMLEGQLKELQDTGS